MRKSCLFCVSKHISQAIVLTMESVMGYPIHLWLAVGHLAEAESESCSGYPDFAKEVREVRLSLMGQKGIFSHDSLMELLKKARALAEAGNNISEDERINQILLSPELKKDVNYLPESNKWRIQRRLLESIFMLSFFKINYWQTKQLALIYI